jgi:hypothetical protein
MLKERQPLGLGHQSTSRLAISRISPCLEHYRQNCCVRGLAEIDQMVAAVEASKKRLRELRTEVVERLVKEVAREMEEAVGDGQGEYGVEMVRKWAERVAEFKKTYGQVEVDFERRENDVREAVWLVDVAIVYMRANLKAEDGEDLKDLPEAKPMDYTSFKSLDSSFTTLNLAKKADPNSKEAQPLDSDSIRRLYTFFADLKQSLKAAMKSLQSAQTAEEIQTIKEKLASEPWTKIVDIG